MDSHEIPFSMLKLDKGTAILAREEVDDSNEDMEFMEEDEVVVPDAPVSGDDMIDMVFNKDRVQDRKTWLNSFKKDTFLDYSKIGDDGVKYSQFVNQELILFSKNDCARSIAHTIDGFKPSQRKVLFACFKRKLKSEVKVAQLSGYVGEHSAYHHGEQSLQGTIIGMAQNYVGSNNVQLLTPSGQFGTRRMGGKDAASPRYIFTKLEAITRASKYNRDSCQFSNKVQNYVLAYNKNSQQISHFVPCIYQFSTLTMTSCSTILMMMDSQLNQSSTFQ